MQAEAKQNTSQQVLAVLGLFGQKFSSASAALSMLEQGPKSVENFSDFPGIVQIED